MCHFRNGDFYEGEWARGVRHGSGMQQCTDGSSYVSTSPSPANLLIITMPGPPCLPHAA